MKMSLGLAMNNLFKSNEEKFFLDKQKKQQELRKMINFFNEVNKDVSKYQLKIKSSVNIRYGVSSLNNSIQLDMQITKPIDDTKSEDDRVKVPMNPLSKLLTEIAKAKGGPLD